MKFEAEAAEKLGNCKNYSDAYASGRAGVAFPADGVGAGIAVPNLPASSVLQIHYCTLTEMGTLSVYVNNVFVEKVNIHSTGAFARYYTNATIDVDIPGGATLKLQHDVDDSAVNVDYILLGTSGSTLKPDMFNLPPFHPGPGAFAPDWKSLQRYNAPDWFRDAKFGIFNHFTPEVVPEQGDWYYKKAYTQGSPQYEYHVSHYGHPSKFGFIDFLPLFTIKAWNPSALMDSYVNAGAKYFVELGEHHDNFDMWDSNVQPFNATRFGPKRDVVGIMAKEAKARGLHFGITLHATPDASWGVFLPSSYASDTTGPLAGVPYDGRMTVADSAGKFWDGLDPKLFYGPVHKGGNIYYEPADPNTSFVFRALLWRADDVLKYHPDLLYYDGQMYDNWGPDNIPITSQLTMANFYNKNMQWNGGKNEAVMNVKNVGQYHKPLVCDDEGHGEETIMAYPWQTDTSISGWSYTKGDTYESPLWVIKFLVNNVARNGNLLLNVPLHADGSMDDDAKAVIENTGAWLRVNGEAIYGSRPFETDTENNTWFTRRAGFVYATAFYLPANDTLVLTSLKKGGATIGKVSSVELLGHGPVAFAQDTTALTIHVPARPKPVGRVSGYVFKITQDKTWINDDDKGVVYMGWTHECNRGFGDFNNDVHLSNEPGDSCELAFTGTGITYFGEKNVDGGNVDIYIDNSLKANVSLLASARETQVPLYSTASLSYRAHTIRIVNKSTNTAVIDAFDVIGPPAVQDQWKPGPIGLVAPPSPPAPLKITWEDPTPITGLNQLDTHGKLVHAGYWGSDQLTVTANTEKITFMPCKLLGDGSTVTTAATSAAGVGKNGYSYNTGDPNLNAVLNTFAWDGPNPRLVTLGGLVPGHSYEAQLFALDDRSGDGDRIVRFGNTPDFSDVNSKTYQQKENDFVIAHFKAVAQTVTIYQDFTQGANFNAYVLRDVTP
jgi:alpha-L-fucosidase